MRYQVTLSPKEIHERVRDLEKNGYAVSKSKFSAEFLTKLRFQAETIIDVGVHSGTPELYKTFPTKQLVLFDPQADVEAKVRKRFHKQAIDFYNVALGAEPGELTLHMTGGGSGLLEKHGGGYESDARYAGSVKVQVARLDDVLAGRNYPKPYGLKIDTEGFELNVLRGAMETLKNTEFVIAEVSVRPRFKGSYTFSEIVKFLADNGLHFLAILNDRPGVQSFYDCLFVQSSHAALVPKD
jgi:FkbM family methyltransferase